MIKVYFWRVPKRYIPWAFSRMALDRIALWRMEGVSFWKLLGTGKGETFTPRDGDATRWGLLVVIDDNKIDSLNQSKLLNRWREKSSSEFSAELQPISVTGKWSGATPFSNLSKADSKWEGPVVAITRARIKWRKNFLFWRSVPPVTHSLHNSPGLKAAIGRGEAPIGLQGTFSLWESGEAVRNFAYRGEAHKAVIAATHREKWYAEELFGRFAVTKAEGNL